MRELQAGPGVLDPFAALGRVRIDIGGIPEVARLARQVVARPRAVDSGHHEGVEVRDGQLAGLQRPANGPSIRGRQVLRVGVRRVAHDFGRGVAGPGDLIERLIE